MNPDELLMQIYNDMLDVMASGRPTGSTERLANELRAYLGQPEWPTLETSAATPYEDCTCIWDLNRKYILKIDPSCRYMGVSHHAENTVAERSWPMCRKCEQRHLVGSECGSQF